MAVTGSESVSLTPASGAGGIDVRGVLTASPVAQQLVKDLEDPRNSSTAIGDVRVREVQDRPALRIM